MKHRKFKKPYIKEVWDSSKWDSGRWDGWGIILGLIPLFFATSGPTKRRKHYVRLLFSQYWTGVQKNQCSSHFSKQSIPGVFYLEPNRKVNATTLELFTTNLKTFKKNRPTDPFSNLDFLPKSGFPKTRDLSPGVIHDFWKIDVIDACLMVHGSWLKAHGSWP